MGLDLYQINGPAEYGYGMRRVTQILRDRGALATALDVQTLQDRVLSEMEGKCPKPFRKHFTRVLRREKTPEAKAFRQELHARMDELRALKHEGDDRIPEHKLMCNSGWIVTPAECRAILRVLTPPLKHDDDFPYGFVRFVEECQETGFTVD